MNEFDEKYRQRYAALSTTNISDALDALGLRGATYGVRPIIERWDKVLGRAVTLKVIAAGQTAGQHHLGIRAIDVAQPGDVIVIDNGGRLDVSCWGGVLANGAKMKGVNGVFIDGAVRDVDECIELGFSVYARGTVVATARGRTIEESTNSLIQFAGVQVRPGDVVMGDQSGVVIVPWEYVEDTLVKAEQLKQKEDRIIADIRAGMSMVEVDQKYNYEKMLK